MPAALYDRLIEHWGHKQVYIGRACSLMGAGIVEVVWGPLCQDISHVHQKETLVLTAVCRHGASCAWAQPGTIIIVSAQLSTS